LKKLQLPYKVHKIDATKYEQKEPWYVKINPNGRVPALTDTLPRCHLVYKTGLGAIPHFGPVILARPTTDRRKDGYDQAGRFVQHIKGQVRMS
jgi:hypothetical protein